MDINNDSIFRSKLYMIEYKFLLDVYNLNIGLIGRFLEKLFGTSKYADIETELEIKYDLLYNQAVEILCYSNNKDYIYDPFK